MVGILSRFKDVMKVNVIALLDRTEDPEKTVDTYMRDLNTDLGKVKAETASVLSDERRAKRALDECSSEIKKAAAICGEGRGSGKRRRCPEVPGTKSGSGREAERTAGDLRIGFRKRRQDETNAG